MRANTATTTTTTTPASCQPNRTDYFARCIRAARKRAGLTQAQLATMAGMRQTNISALERARRHPTEPTLLAIAQALGLSLAELVAMAG